MCLKAHCQQCVPLVSQSSEFSIGLKISPMFVFKILISDGQIILHSYIFDEKSGNESCTCFNIRSEFSLFCFLYSFINFSA